MNEQSGESLNKQKLPSIQDRIKQVVEYFADYNGVAVAFSGGVDSSTLAALALKAQGDTAVAITAHCRSLSRAELESAKRTAASLGIKHIIIPYNELEEPGFADNPVDRCYHCKKGLYRNLLQLTQKCGFEIVADGTNASEMTEQRPGYRAAQEFGIKTPFADFGVTKNEIRKMAKCIGLSIWDKPQQACMSSRFPYGHLITEEGLARVEAAEQFLAHLGLNQLRVRDYGRCARIEVQPDDFSHIVTNREVVIKRFKDFGYSYITLDLEGFRSGSMNEVSLNRR